MVCKCGALLYLDLRAVHDLVMLGYVGGRTYCHAGCPQPGGGWFKEFVGVPIAEREAPERRGHYKRKVRSFVCHRLSGGCGKPFTSLGIFAKRCPDCRLARKREYDHTRHSKKRVA